MNTLHIAEGQIWRLTSEGPWTEMPPVGALVVIAMIPVGIRSLTYRFLDADSTRYPDRISERNMFLAHFEIVTTP